MKTIYPLFFILLIYVASSFALEDDQRSLLKRTVYIVTQNGAVESADYWSIPLGNFDFKVKRKYPGEGTVTDEGSANLAFISSGYIEGSGYCDRGKIAVKAEFVIKDGDSTKIIELKDINYIYYGANKIVLTGETEPRDLFLMIEEEENTYPAKKLGIMIYKFNKEWGELKHSKDYDRIIGFSFTKEGAKKAYKAALAANN